jgi:hypothetical protein
MRLLASILFVAGVSFAQGSWSAVCMEGPLGVPAGKCRIELGTDRVSFTAKKAAPMSVPATTISDVIYSPARFRRSEGMGVGACSGPAEGCGLLAVATGATWLILYPMKGTHHYVSIVWEDRGTQQEVLLELGKGEYLQFLEALRQLTGKPWVAVSVPKR